MGGKPRQLLGTKDEKLIRQTLSKSAAEQKADIEAAGEKAIFSYNQTDFVKDRVALEVQFGKYAFVAYDLFVKHLAFYVRDKIDVGIEILPMKSLQQHLSSAPVITKENFTISFGMDAAFPRFRS